MKMDFEATFLQLQTIYLLIKLLHKIMEEKLLKIPFSIMQLTKKSRTQFFGAEYIFSNFFHWLTNFRKLHFAYSRLVWIPCKWIYDENTQKLIFLDGIR